MLKKIVPDYYNNSVFSVLFPSSSSSKESTKALLAKLSVRDIEPICGHFEKEHWQWLPEEIVLEIAKNHPDLLKKTVGSGYSKSQVFSLLFPSSSSSKESTKALLAKLSAKDIESICGHFEQEHWKWLPRETLQKIVKNYPDLLKKKVDGSSVRSLLSGSHSDCKVQ